MISFLYVAFSEVSLQHSGESDNRQYVALLKGQNRFVRQQQTICCCAKRTEQVGQTQQKICCVAKRTEPVVQIQQTTCCIPKRTEPFFQTQQTRCCIAERTEPLQYCTDHQAAPACLIWSSLTASQHTISCFVLKSIFSFCPSFRDVLVLLLPARQNTEYRVLTILKPECTHT